MFDKAGMRAAMLRQVQHAQSLPEAQRTAGGDGLNVTVNSSTAASPSPSPQCVHPAVPLVRHAALAAFEAAAADALLQIMCAQ